MKGRLIGTILLTAACTVTSSTVFAHYRDDRLTPWQKRAYHACLYATYIRDYCNFHAPALGEGAFEECVVANRAGRIGSGFGYWGLGVEAACREMILHHY